MSRGAEKQVQQEAQTQATNQEALNTQMRQSQQQAQQPIVQGYTNMLNNPQQGMSAVNSAYDAAAQKGQERVAASRNDAGYTGEEDKLAMDRSQTMANTIQNNQTAGLQGLSEMYGMNQQTYNQAMGLPVNYLNTAQNAAANQKSQFSIGVGPQGPSFGYTGG